MTTSRLLALGLCALLVFAGSGCTGHPETSGGPAVGGDATGPRQRVVLLGDSVAAGEAVPLGQAFAASGVEFRSLAADGGGNVVGPFADKHWRTLPDRIESAGPTVVVYQITSYDWGSRAKQRAAYRKLARTVHGTGAALVFVTMPPIKPDDFYRPHLADLAHADDAARAVANSSGTTTLLDAAPVWGTNYQRYRDGKPDRSSDGIHTCPQGAARFTRWLVDKLAARLDFTAAPPTSWANTGWSDDKQFTGC